MDRIDHFYKYSTNSGYRYYYDKYNKAITKDTKIFELKELLSFAENPVETEAIKQRMRELLEWKE